MADLLQFIQTEFQAAIATPERQPIAAVSQRLTSEVQRMCQESARIQAAGNIQYWQTKLAQHRIQQCLTYYELGSLQGRIELQSILSSIVYRYITPLQVRSSYRARVNLIEDFLQGFYVETLNAFRRENMDLGSQYRPRLLLELAEYMAFSERYAKRRFPVGRIRSQQLVILRAQTLAQQPPPVLPIDGDQAEEGSNTDANSHWQTASTYRLREQTTPQSPDLGETAMRDAVVHEFIQYLQARDQDDCVHYFQLRLQDRATHQIEAALGISPRERDYLQQRFKYHQMRFALLHCWELVHQWLGADLERNLGLTPQEWQRFQANLTPRQQQLLALMTQRCSRHEMLQILGCTKTQLQRLWSKLLEQAWEIRNRPMSGAGINTDE